MITNYDYSDAPLFEVETTDKQIIITIDGKPDQITNTELYDDGIVLEESLCSEQQLRFGACESNQIKVKMSATAVSYSLEGMTIHVKEYLDGHSANLLDIGTYKVVSDEKNADTDERVITAYDALKDILEADVSDWYNTLLPTAQSTTTIALMRTSFFSHFGITQEAVTLPNDSMPVSKTYSTPLAGARVIRDICEANGTFGHMTRDNKFRYINVVQQSIPLYPSDDLYPSDTLYPSDGFNRVMSMLSQDGGYISGEFENFSVEKITQLEILSEAGDVGQTIGSGTNIYTIEDNALFFGKSAADLTTYGTILFNEIKDATYTPYELEALGSPCYEVGDGVICQTHNGLIKSYILKRTLTGVQSLTDEYSASGEATYTRDFGGIRSNVQALQNKANILTRTVDETVSEIYDQNGNSRITQNANSITSEVNRATGAESGLSSRITQNANSISAEVTNRQGADSALGLRIDGVTQTLSLYVKFGESYSGIEITKTKVHIKTGGTFQVDAGNLIITEDGDVTVKGRIEANSGNIGILEITADGLELNSQPVLIQDAQNRLMVGNSTKTTAIYGSRLYLTGGDLTIDTGASGTTGIDGDVWLRDNVEIGAPLTPKTLTYNGENVYWQKLSDILNNANAYVLTDVAS